MWDVLDEVLAPDPRVPWWVYPHVNALRAEVVALRRRLEIAEGLIPHRPPAASVSTLGVMDYTHSRIHLTSGVSVTLAQPPDQTHSDLESSAQFVPFTNVDGRMAVVSPAHVAAIVGLTKDELDEEAETLRLQREAASWSDHLMDSEAADS